MRETPILDVVAGLPIEFLDGHLEFTNEQRDGSLTIHYSKGQPRKIESTKFRPVSTT